MDIFILGHVLLFAICCCMSFVVIYRDGISMGRNSSAFLEIIFAVLESSYCALPIFALFEIVYWGLYWIFVS